MELRELSLDDLKQNSYLLAYAYETNADLFPCFFEYEYEGITKYLYCFDNWFTILKKIDNKKIDYCGFSLNADFELMHTGYENFYVAHNLNGFDTIVDHSNNMYYVIRCGKEENSNNLQDGYITFTQTKIDKAESLAMIYSTFYIENKKIFKEYMKKPHYYYLKKRFHKPEIYLRKDVDYSETPIFFNMLCIREYGLSNVLKNGSISLQKRNNVTRYFKLPFKNEFLNGIFASFSSDFYDEESFEEMIKGNGFFTDIPDYVIDFYNSNNKQFEEYKILADAIKSYYNKNNKLLVLNLDREVIK